MAKHKSMVIKPYPEGKKVVVIGATSGLGRGLALLYLEHGCTVGLAGRRTGRLEEVAGRYPGKAFYRTMDVLSDDCVDRYRELLDEMGGADVVIYSAGVGAQNPTMDINIEMDTINTNVDGYARIAIYSYNYFRERGYGHIVCISSLAGILPLRQSPAYSATKRFQIQYTSALAQKANKENLEINFTTLIPGFIRTEMLKYKYPFTISAEKGVRLIYNAIEKRRRYTTIPGRWRWIQVIWRLIPNYFWERIW